MPNGNGQKHLRYMALTGKNLLDRLAEMEGTAFSSWDEAQIAIRVAHINGGLRWAWKDDDPKFAFPFTVGSGTVAVTSGAIAASLLGDGTWCSLFSADPRPAGTSYYKVYATVSQSGVHPTTSEASVFAFYRNTVPQLTYVAESDYSDPDDIPDALLDIVALRALSGLYVGMQQWDALKGLKGVYGEPQDARDALKIGLLATSQLPWAQHAIVIAPA